MSMKANELKVTDLMVGDWVSCQINSIEVKYVRIASLNKTTMNGIPADFIEFNKVTVDMLHGNYYQVDIASVHPIPLTPEILEKNGFKTEFYNDYKIYELNNFKVCKNCCDYFEVCDLWDDSDWGWRIIDFCPCVYVHQLQHALRLCGIDKEIVV